MKKGLFFMKGILLPFLSAFSQDSPDKTSPLTIGHQLPEIVFNSVTNYKSKTARLSDFKGKIIILDFWSSFCGSCINLFPHLDSLQQKFKNDLQIILVNTKSKKTKDDEAKILKIIERVRSKTGCKMDMPVVYDCEELDTYFPCKIIPHEVWIDKNGVVAGISPSNELTAANIQAMIEGKNVSMKFKQDRFGVNLDKPLFIAGNGGDGSETLYRSLVTTGIDGLNGGTGIRRADSEKVNGFYSINQSLLSLIKTAYHDKEYHNNRILLNNKEKFEQVYSYELIVPPMNIETLFEYMRSDLTKYFNVRVKEEKSRLKCLVLKRTKHAKAISYNSQKPDLDLDDRTKHKYIHNYPLSFVVDFLNRYSELPIIDETNISSNISIDLPYDLMDISGLRDAFHKIGIDLVEETRALEVLVVYDT